MKNGEKHEKTSASPSGGSATSVRVFLYDAENFDEVDATAIGMPVPAGKNLWIHVDGLRDAKRLKEIGEALHLHPLVIEDIQNPAQRPNLEDYGDYLFFIVKSVRSLTKKHGTDQLSFAFGHNYLLSVQEKPGEPFASACERLRNKRGPARRMGPDFLAHALFDVVIDHSTVVLHETQEKIDALEDAMINKPNGKLLHQMHQMRRSLLMLPRTLRTLSDMASTCVHTESPLISRAIRPYFRDLRDHINSTVDIIEVMRGILSGMLDLYLSSINNRMNEVMKTLTMISTIFIPLSFLAGVYGMNFQYMPELLWKWGYPIFWGIAAAIVGIMVYVFKRKKWI